MSDFGCGTELFPLSALLNRRHTEVADLTIPYNTLFSLTRFVGMPGFIMGMSGSRYSMQLLNDVGDTVTVRYRPNGVLDTETETVEPGRLLSIDRLIEWLSVGGHTVRRVTDPSTSDVTYWSHFGIEHVELPENTPLAHSIWERVCLRFDESFYDRFLAGETMEQWQRRLQVITDRTIPTYERALRIYAENAGDIDTVTGVSQTTEYLNVRDASKGKSRGRVAETPDTAVNEDQSYAGSVSDGSNESENVKTGKVRTTMTVSGGLAEVLNANIDAWRDLETELVDEYRQAFLSLVWY